MKNKEPLTPGKFGRSRTYLNDQDRLLILKIHKEQKCSARRLEKIIEHKYGRHIPHNSIHQILLENDLAHEDKKKKKRRKLWIRYPERTASKFDALYYRGLLEKAWAEVAFMFPKDYGRHSHEIRPRAERSALSPKQIVNLEGVRSRWQEVSVHKKRSDLGAKVVPYYAGIGYLDKLYNQDKQRFLSVTEGRLEEDDSLPKINQKDSGIFQSSLLLTQRAL